MNQTNSLPTAGSHFISLAIAAAMTATYRSNREAMLDPDYQGKNVLALSETFNVQDIQALIAQDGCAGVRIYYGQQETDTVHAIMVAVDAENADILTGGENSLLSEENIIIEEGQRCPPVCPPVSPLNS